jgi:hypothetical protein
MTAVDETLYGRDNEMDDYGDGSYDGSLDDDEYEEEEEEEEEPETISAIEEVVEVDENEPEEMPVTTAPPAAPRPKKAAPKAARRKAATKKLHKKTAKKTAKKPATKKAAAPAKKKAAKKQSKNTAIGRVKKVVPTQKGAQLGKAHKPAATKKNALKRRARQPKVARKTARLNCGRAIEHAVCILQLLPSRFRICAQTCRRPEGGRRECVDRSTRHRARRSLGSLGGSGSDQGARILVILSPVSVVSDSVRDEVSFALNRQKRVIPVLYRDCDVPFRLARLQHIDFRTNYARSQGPDSSTGVERQSEVTAQITGPAIVTLSSVSDVSYGHTIHMSGTRDSDPWTTEKMASDADRERQRIPAEYARLDEERRHTEADPARLDEKRKQAEIDRRTLVAQQARLEQERQSLATAQTRLAEDLMHTTAERARFDRLGHERRVAAGKRVRQKN